MSQEEMNSEKSEMRAPQSGNGMKQGSIISASLGAIISSLATMACCLPLGFAGALGAAGASAFLQRFRPWLLGLSIVLLGVGFWQQRRAKLCAVKRNYTSAVLLWTAVVLVVAMIVFPQEIAGFIADHFSGAAR
jgi:predicted phage tail protein